MNHYVMLYEMENGGPMRQSFWCTEEDPKKVAGLWETKTKKKCIGHFMMNPNNKDGDWKDNKPFHLTFKDGYQDTVIAKTGADAITQGYNKRNIPIEECSIVCTSQEPNFDTCRVNYDVPKHQAKAKRIKRPTKKSTATQTQAFDFLGEVDEQCQEHKYNEE